MSDTDHTCELTDIYVLVCDDGTLYGYDNSEPRMRIVEAYPTFDDAMCRKFGLVEYDKYEPSDVPKLVRFRAVAVVEPVDVPLKGTALKLRSDVA